MLKWLPALMLGLVGCTLPDVDPLPVLPTVVPTAVAPTATPMPTDSGWELLHPGLERRTIHLFYDSGEPREQLYLLRLEPDQFVFQIAYTPGHGHTLAEWQAKTGALVLVNGGFFTAELVATGLMMVAGVASGSSYGDFAGMLAITAAGPEVRWLGQRPFDPQEPLLYALQSFPMLVKPGGIVGFAQEDNQPNRRTAVAQDGNGRLLFVLAPWGSFTLHQFSTYLTQADLDLDVALNLDGGTSTGLLLAEPHEEVTSFTPLPAVIAIYPR